MRDTARARRSPRPSRLRFRERAARRALGAGKVDPLPLPLRCGRQRAVRAHHGAARVLPDAHRDAHPARARRRDRARCRARQRADRVRLRLEHQDRALARKDASSFMPTCRSTSATRRCAMRRRASSSAFPICACCRCAATSRRALALPAEIDGRPRLGFFPGSTIGNLTEAAAVKLLANMAGILGSGARLIIGADLKKDVRRLLRAYDDEEGVTAAFNLNLLKRANRELDTDFDVGQFDHLAHLRRAPRARRALPRQPGRADGQRAGSAHRFRGGRAHPHRAFAQVRHRGLPRAGGQGRLAAPQGLDRRGRPVQRARAGGGVGLRAVTADALRARIALKAPP